MFVRINKPSVTVNIESFARRPKSGYLRALNRWIATAIPASLAIWILSRCVILSGKRLMWLDELLTWYPVSGTFGSMWSSTSDTINASPPLYFVFLWFWAQLFGHSAMALRLFSACALVIAILVMFHVLRRTYSRLSAGIALAFVSSSPYLLQQGAQARFHTFFLAEFAIAILIYQQLARTPKPSGRLLAANACIHGCMIMTHYMAPLYSGIILVAIAIAGLIRRQNPLLPGLSIVVGWMAFLPWIPAFFHHAEMGKPNTWIAVPGPTALVGYYKSYLGPNFSVWAGSFAVLAAIGLIFAIANARRVKLFSPGFRELPLLILGAGLLLAPLAVYVLSRCEGSTPVFNSRYLLASSLGWAIVIAQLVDCFMRRCVGVAKRKAADIFVVLQLAAAVVLTALMIRSDIRGILRAKPNSIASIETVLKEVPAGGTIVISDIHAFLGAHFYSPQSARLFYITDIEVGMQEKNGGAARHRIMAALKCHFPERFREVLSTEEFFSSAPAIFWVRPAGGLWANIHLLRNPLFKLKRINPSLLRVERSRQ